MIEQQNLDALRREVYLRLAGLLGTIDELLGQPDIVLDGGYTRRACREPCECYLVDGEEAFAEMLLGGVDGFDQDETCRECDDGCEVPLRLFAS